MHAVARRDPLDTVRVDAASERWYGGPDVLLQPNGCTDEHGRESVDSKA